MNKSMPVVIVGAGGHAKVVIDIVQLNNGRILGVTDINDESPRDILGIPVVGRDDFILQFSPQELLLINGLGSTTSTLPRQELYNRFKSFGYNFKQLMHPTAIVSRYVEFGEGIQIFAGAILQPGCQLGHNIIVNTKASLDHDCKIGSHVHIAPGVTVSGSVSIGEGTHVGTGAVVIQGVRIGNNCIIGAGAVVINDVEDGDRVVGVPARVVKK